MILRHALVLAALAASVSAQSDPAITAWLVNKDGSKGKSTNAAIHAQVSLIAADVQSVAYTPTDAYVKSTGVPSHFVGPFAAGPNAISNQTTTHRIPRTPSVPATKTATGLGAIGVMTNGVVFFNPKDARSYNNLGIWNQNAIVFEAATFDASFGHPVPTRGTYHYHQHPALLRAQRCDTGAHHSGVVGFAFDGFPVYGPYGYANTTGGGGIKRMISGNELRSITVRQTLPNGSPLPPSQYGPPVSATYPLGCYVEDFEFVSTLGDLDLHNGRTCVTPEYPGGTYAYFMTLDAAGASAYPYIIGPSYYGTLVTENMMGMATVPGTAVAYASGGETCYGQGCGASPLALSFSGIASIGTTLTFDVHRGPASGAGFVCFGMTNGAPFPIDLTPAGAPGCFVYQSPDAAVPVTYAASAASLPVSIPASTGIVGVFLYVQGVAVDPGANVLGVRTSNGGRVIVRP